MYPTDRRYHPGGREVMEKTILHPLLRTRLVLQSLQDNRRLEVDLLLQANQYPGVIARNLNLLQGQQRSQDLCLRLLLEAIPKRRTALLLFHLVRECHLEKWPTALTGMCRLSYC